MAVAAENERKTMTLSQLLPSTSPILFLRGCAACARSGTRRGAAGGRAWLLLLGRAKTSRRKTLVNFLALRSHPSIISLVRRLAAFATSNVH